MGKVSAEIENLKASYQETASEFQCQISDQEEEKIQRLKKELDGAEGGKWRRWQSPDIWFQAKRVTAEKKLKAERVATAEKKAESVATSKKAERAVVEEMLKATEEMLKEMEEQMKRLMAHTST
ncbi:hypothetical protein C0995_016139 [Termitomyces sp. Mi166|nr:hypothetical protein C0995_016139 [Termitomyces sp. Mi166\